MPAMIGWEWFSDSALKREYVCDTDLLVNYFNTNSLANLFNCNPGIHARFFRFVAEKLNAKFYGELKQQLCNLPRKDLKRKVQLKSNGRVST